MELPFPLAPPPVSLLVGHVGTEHARIAVRGASSLSVRGANMDRVVPVVAGLAELEGLEADSVYAIEAAGVSGRVRTLPRDRLCFAFVSCHLPFEKRLGKIVVRDSASMLDALTKVVAERDVHFVLHLGDQVYADPEHLHAIDLWRVARRRRRRGEDVDAVALYRALYDGYWALPSMQRLHATTSNLMMWDDGEIHDVWGSSPLAARDRPIARTMFAAAREVFVERQRLHGPPRVDDETWAYAFDAGPASFFVLDLRSVRDHAARRLLGDAQWRALERWIAETDERPLRFLASSVPLLHTPDSLVKKATRGPLGAVIPDPFLDRWSADAFHPELVRLMALLEGRNIVVLAGDIHIGAAMDLWNTRKTHVTPQWISSAITHHAGLVHRLEAELTSLAANAASAWPITAHFHELANNFGVVEVERDGDRVRATFELFVRTPEGSELRHRVRTPW